MTTNYWEEGLKAGQVNPWTGPPLSVDVRLTGDAPERPDFSIPRRFWPWLMFYLESLALFDVNMGAWITTVARFSVDEATALAIADALDAALASGSFAAFQTSLGRPTTTWTAARVLAFYHEAHECFAADVSTVQQAPPSLELRTLAEGFARFARISGGFSISLL